MITDKLITETIEQKKPFFDKDRYGQTPIFNYRIHNLFPDTNLREQVIKYFEKNGLNSIYRLSTYSGVVGVYQAITKK